ncbi:acyl-CoA dehydrogenase family protein [Novosphingobium lindaniclasticum]|uniref:Acyl-CoA dehydrogenase n=1 Tax=Novosphingobium lindaniclasticum LE124 TaxID=1096930 RepID=T0HQ82_9SPHN|nr:acyl-CoA dehydrogenase [Novosphingobium lindaniclasticum]EQB14293.1 hypothetical protein L284_12930 [Novosphingobium lindaniclasticum LE124]
MDFNLNDEQRLLSDTINRFVTDRYDFEHRLAAMAQPDGFSRSTWEELAELGLLALPFAEEDGGFGGGGLETMIVMEACGKGLLLEPFLATAILAGGALRLAGSDPQKSQRIEEIISGAHIMALAHHEPDGPRHTLTRLTTQALPVEGGGWRIDGRKTAVIAGAAADELVVSALAPQGPSLFLVDAANPGVTVVRRHGYDGVALADIAFDDVRLDEAHCLGVAGEGAQTLRTVFEHANAAVCAEAVGIMSDILDTTIEFLRTRTQFGVPIGSFQALQHRAVDMLMELEMARSMAMLAAMSLELDAEPRARNIAAAKARVGSAARMLGQQAVQLHGAIGLTMEYKVGHGFKRLTAIDALFGDADHHLDALAQAGGLLANA